MCKEDEAIFENRAHSVVFLTNIGSRFPPVLHFVPKTVVHISIFLVLCSSLEEVGRKRRETGCESVGGGCAHHLDTSSEISAHKRSFLLVVMFFLYLYRCLCIVFASYMRIYRSVGRAAESIQKVNRKGRCEIRVDNLKVSFNTRKP